MSDYKAKFHNLYMTTSFLPTDKLSITGTVNYSLSTGEIDPVEMPDISDRLNGSLPHQDFTFEEMHTYSNIDYSLLAFGLTGEYSLAPGVRFSANVDYADLTDDAGYVYGIESGSILIVSAGLRFDF